MREPDWDALADLQFLLYNRIAGALNEAISSIELSDMPEAQDKPPGYWKNRALTKVVNVLNLFNAWTYLIRYKQGLPIPDRAIRPFRANDLLKWIGVQLQLNPIPQLASNPLPGTVFSIANHMEQIPDPENRVYLSDRVDHLGVNRLAINWRIGRMERESLVCLHGLLEEALRSCRMGDAVGALSSVDGDWPVSRYSGHHIGTTRMSVDPKSGVVDLNSRVHGLQNLYLAGSSVFPTSGHSNPTLTLIALSIRLADHLKQLYRTGQVLQG